LCDLGNLTFENNIPFFTFYFILLDSKKLLLVSSSGILTVIHCSESIPLSCTYLAVTKVIAVFIISQTIIVSDGVNLFLITFDNQFSKIIKQVVSPLKGTILFLNNIT